MSISFTVELILLETACTYILAVSEGLPQRHQSQLQFTGVVPLFTLLLPFSTIQIDQLCSS